MKDTIINSIIVTVILAGMLGITLWSAQHDKEVGVASDKYEECVKTEMHTTPTAYYDSYGVMPICK